MQMHVCKMWDDRGISRQRAPQEGSTRSRLYTVQSRLYSALPRLSPPLLLVAHKITPVLRLHPSRASLGERGGRGGRGGRGRRGGLSDRRGRSLHLLVLLPMGHERCQRRRHQTLQMSQLRLNTNKPCLHLSLRLRPSRRLCSRLCLGSRLGPAQKRSPSSSARLRPRRAAPPSRLPASHSVPDRLHARCLTGRFGRRRRTDGLRQQQRLRLLDLPGLERLEVARQKS